MQRVQASSTKGMLKAYTMIFEVNSGGDAGGSPYNPSALFPVDSLASQGGGVGGLGGLLSGMTTWTPGPAPANTLHPATAPGQTLPAYLRECSQNYPMKLSYSSIYQSLFCGKICVQQNQEVLFPLYPYPRSLPPHTISTCVVKIYEQATAELSEHHFFLKRKHKQNPQTWDGLCCRDKAQHTRPQLIRPPLPQQA